MCARLDASTRLPYRLMWLGRVGGVVPVFPENNMEFLIALVALTALEIVLGIDNIVFIAILTDKLPPEHQSQGRHLGLALAMVMRLLLLLSLSWILGLGDALFTLTGLGLPESMLPGGEHATEVNEISGKDLILFAGGLFLIWKSVTEIHEKIERATTPVAESADAQQRVSLSSVLAQIAVMDIVFSLDSVITAVGTVQAKGENFWVGIGVMATAIIIAVGVMMLYANPISRFVSEHASFKILAMAFLILIGVMLVAESIGTPIAKGYIYFAMAFALIVQVLNMRMQAKISTTAE